MNYVYIAILLVLPFFSFCHRPLPNWWNSPHQSLIGMGPLVAPSTNFKVADLSKIKEGHYGVILRENGVRYVVILNMKPNGGKPEINGMIFPSGNADKMNFFTGQLEEGKDRTWIRLVTKPAQEAWGTRQAYATKLDIQTRLSLLEDSEGNIYLHPTSEKGAVYSTEPSEIFKVAQGRWTSKNSDAQWDLNLNRVEGNYLWGNLTSKSNKGTCSYQAVATTSLAINRFFVFTTENQNSTADCPEYVWEAVLPANKNDPYEFGSLTSKSPALTFSRK